VGAAFRSIRLRTTTLAAGVVVGNASEAEGSLGLGLGVSLGLVLGVSLGLGLGLGVSLGLVLGVSLGLGLVLGVSLGLGLGVSLGLVLGLGVVLVVRSAPQRSHFLSPLLSTWSAAGSEIIFAYMGVPYLSSFCLAYTNCPH